MKLSGRCAAAALGMAALAAGGETFTFDVPKGCETAVCYDEKLEVTPLDAGAKSFSVEVAARPVRSDGGRVVQKAAEPFVHFLPGRMVNIAPWAHVAVSSHGPAETPGFKPTPGLNRPYSLNDEVVNPMRNFKFADRRSPPGAADPEWVLLTWRKAVPIAGAMVFTGSFESFPRHEDAVFEVYAGDGDPQLDADASHWRAVPGEWSAMPKNDRANFRNWRTCLFSKPVAAAALRLKLTGGGWTLHGRQGETLTPGLGEIAVFTPWKAAGAPRRSESRGVAIPFTMPFDGLSTIQVRDGKGRVVANPAAGVAFGAGPQKAWWNLDGVDGRPVLEPGVYSWRGIAVPPLRLDYRFSYYPLGLPGDRRTWMTSDRTGGWLADHDPPRGVVRDGTNMWLNAWAEHGDSVIETDLDMRKLWGVTRIWVAVPQEICVDGGYCYGYSQAGWNGTDEEIVRIDRRTKETRKVFLLKNPPAKKGESAFWNVTVTGFQVLGDVAFVAHGPLDEVRVYDISAGNRAKPRLFSWAGVHTQFDELKPVPLKTIRLPRPGRLRKYGDGKLATTTAEGVATIDVRSYAVETLFRRKFDEPLGLAVGGDGLIWVGEGGATHQVAAYTADGREVKRIGRKGRRKVGPWDEDDLEEPAGVEVDALGRVWVAEHTHWEKRVSVWDAATGRCVKSVLGPTQYGGDGCIDPADPSRLFYRGLELRRDAATGAIRPVNLIYRPDAADVQSFPDKKGRANGAGDYPAYCFRARGALWFTSFMPPHRHPRLVLWRHDGKRVWPVASVGTTASITGCVAFAVSPERDGRFYTWTDLDGDGFMGRGEMKFGDVAFEGGPLSGVMAGWNWRMNEDFAAAGATEFRGPRRRVVVFRPSGFTERGLPRYDIPKDSLPAPVETQALMPDSAGRVVALGGPVTSIASDGSENWTYRNEWPGLHAGHRTTARGDEPGVLIAPTRIWGMARTRGDAGEVVCFNSNLGCAYLMTAEDGLFIDRVFRDQRVAPTVWNFDVVPDSATLAETSLYDEHFGGTFSRVRGADGRERDLFVVGKGDCSVVELSGLDGVKRLAGGTFRVTADDVAAAEARRARDAARRAEPKVCEAARGRPGAKSPSAENVRLGCDERFLYVASSWKDDAAPFANGGDNPFELFKTGDTLEVMLRTRAPSSARGVQPGDVRLVFAPFKGKNICVMYDYKVPGTPESARVAFSSPWRTLHVDRVSIVEQAEVKVSRREGTVSLEAKVPLEAIHFRPKGDVKGDVGRVFSDASGTRAASRVYWSNKNTAIMSDLPSETEIQPDLWGTFRFR